MELPATIFFFLLLLFFFVERCHLHICTISKCSIISLLPLCCSFLGGETGFEPLLFYVWLVLGVSQTLCGKGSSITELSSPHEALLFTKRSSPSGKCMATWPLLSGYSARTKLAQEGDWLRTDTERACWVWHLSSSCGQRRFASHSEARFTQSDLSPFPGSGGDVTDPELSCRGAQLWSKGCLMYYQEAF